MMEMNVLVCIKRVPDTGAKFELTDDEQDIVTRHLGFTISPHEECAVEEAIRIVEQHGGSSTVLTLGPAEAEEQLRESLAKGVDRGILLETDGSEWDPGETARAIVEGVRAHANGSPPFDLLLFGNEAADTGNYQVGIRVATALELPCVTGVKDLALRDGAVVAKREIPSGWEVFEVSLPAVVTVKEGINLPRHPSLRGTMMAKKKQIERARPERSGSGLEKIRLRLPEERGGEVKILGQGSDAVPRIVDVLKELEVL